MQQLVSVKFKYNPKPLWFDPLGKLYEAGSEVLVETERGREVGVIYEASINASEKDISKLKSPLKPVIRELNDLDYEHIEALNDRGRDAMPFFREKVVEYELEIKPVEVQYLFSGDRAVFFFSSEERVDFRELVRDLAQHFHVRIDMRQIGARDEAKELGGLAHCGEEFCCTRFGGEFQPVSIRMAKEQDLPLNPAKISGACGRLMCCLRYEHEAYKDFKSRAPKKGTKVDTPLGEATISGHNTPSETMELKLEDGKRINVPLEELQYEKGREGCGRCRVSHETISRCATRSMLIALGSLELDGEDIFETGSSREYAGRDSQTVKIETSGGERRKRRRSQKKESTEEATAPSARSASLNVKAAAETDATTPARSRSSRPKDKIEERSGGDARRRRRRSGGKATQAAASQKGAVKENQNVSEDLTGRRDAETTADKPRPGQRSSGLRKRHRKTQTDIQVQKNAADKAPQAQRSSPAHAKKRASSGQKAANQPHSEQAGHQSSQKDTVRKPRRQHKGGTSGVSSNESNDNQDR